MRMLVLALLLMAPAAHATFGALSTLFPSVGPEDELWHLKATGVDRAHARFPARGEGVLIAQPDTGWAPHPEIPLAALDLVHDRDLINGQPSALDEGMARDGLLSVPGHFAQAQGLLVSPVRGVAPAARVLPLKVSHGVILVDTAPMTAAIHHAIDVGADIIAIAQGTPFSDEALREAIRRATRAGVIVVAAAGNGTPFVVYPAAFDEVIAVAATVPAGGPFLFGSFGPEVDIAAPGAQVTTTWVTRDLFEGRAVQDTRPTYGTTLASAQVAGVAALWLSHNPGVRERYGARTAGVFRDLLSRTARRPPGWPAERYGAGVVDAAALLSAPLPPE